jgi:hypothetical protein
MCLIAGAYLRSYTPRLQDRSWYENEVAHHVFFIPVTVWGAIYFVAGVAYLIYAWR